MSHHGGGGGGHGHMGGHHPDQSPGWNQALQGEAKAITSLPNRSIVPIFGALLVFGIMLLPFVVNWGDGGIELPWVTQQRDAAEKAEQAKGRDNVGGQINASAADPVSALTANLGAGASGNAARPQASFDQQLLYASQQGFAGRQQPAAPQAQEYNQQPPQPYSTQNYSQQSYGQSYPQAGYNQSAYNQGQYGQQAYPQSNYAANGAANYQGGMIQPPQRHRVWVDR